jgi:hypothetical protein
MAMDAVQAREIEICREELLDLVICEYDMVAAPCYGWEGFERCEGNAGRCVEDWERDGGIGKGGLRRGEWSSG